MNKEKEFLEIITQENVKIEKLKEFFTSIRENYKYEEKINLAKDVVLLLDKFLFNISNYLSQDIIAEYRFHLNNLKIKIDQIEKDEIPVKVVVAGCYSTGKSSVINSLLQKDLIPTGDEPITLAPSIFKYDKELKIILEFTNGNKKEISFNEFQEIKHSSKNKISNIKIIHFYYPYEKLTKLHIIDTPGFNTADKKGDDIKTFEIIKDEANVIIWIFDSSNQTNTEKDIIDKIRKEYKIPLIGIVNKMDLKSPSEREAIINYIKNEFGISIIIPYSAKKILAHLNNELDKWKKELLDVFENFLNLNKKEVYVKIEGILKKNIIIKDKENNKTYKISSELKKTDWLKNLNQLEEELNSIRLNSKEIILTTTLNEIEKFLLKILPEIDSTLKSIKSEIEKLKLEKENLVYIKNNIKNNMAMILNEIKNLLFKYTHNIKKAYKEIFDEFVMISLDEGIIFDEWEIFIFETLLNKEKIKKIFNKNFNLKEFYEGYKSKIIESYSNIIPEEKLEKLFDYDLFYYPYDAILELISIWTLKVLKKFPEKLSKDSKFKTKYDVKNSLVNLLDKEVEEEQLEPILEKILNYHLTNIKKFINEYIENQIKILEDKISDYNKKIEKIKNNFNIISDILKLKPKKTKNNFSVCSILINKLL